MRVGLRKKTLLIVDDNAAVLESLVEIGTAVGFAVTSATSRRSALQAIDRQCFDAALVDKRLVELDAENRDGLAILGHIKERGEGTSLILLTGLGQYHDAVEASEKYGARLLEKSIDLSFDAKLRQVLTETISAAPVHRHAAAIKIWCGDEDPIVWESKANTLLHPKPNIGVLLKILEDLAVTCEPLLDRPHNGGLREIPSDGLAGVFWSRGIGSAVIVSVQREPPRNIKLPAGWPERIVIQEKLHEVSKKDLVGTIHACSGLEPTVFPDIRSSSE